LATPVDVSACADVRELAGTYVYLLGIYLGDGWLTRAPRNVWRLRIALDNAYPGIIGECAEAILSISSRASGRVPRKGCFEVYSNWKHWLCLFPQHGAGPKHLRPIVLTRWQSDLVDRYPDQLLRGLIQSDGCRTINSVWRPARDGGRRRYTYPRYLFVNHSREIRELFGRACDRLGIEWRQSNTYILSVARREAVRRLDQFVGPKR
jgi:hypothetical protein